VDVHASVDVEPDHRAATVAQVGIALGLGRTPDGRPAASGIIPANEELHAWSTFE
jgi:hypothetical protein